jgi:acid ceramidase/N-acylethanolamine-hydrolysing acid amidase
LVQTNYDRDIPDPKDDLRRTPAENRLRKVGNNISEQVLFD